LQFYCILLYMCKHRNSRLSNFISALRNIFIRSQVSQITHVDFFIFYARELASYSAY